jgi:hypothetical protein
VLTDVFREGRMDIQGYVRDGFRVMMLVCTVTTVALTAGFHVTVTGASTGDGSVSSPWSLEYALSHPSSVKAGDTIWVHGGHYLASGEYTNSKFQAKLRGTAGLPIIVRNYNNERAIIDGNNLPNNYALFVTPECHYTWFWGLEIANFNVTDRLSADFSGALGDHDISMGLVAFGNTDGSSRGNKLVNLIVHDVKLQMMSVDEHDAEMYGCLCYNIGYWCTNNGEIQQTGYPMYAQNQTGRKAFKHNICVNNYDYALHVYGSSAAYLDSFSVDGNILRENPVLIGGSNSSWGDSVVNNVFWRNWTPYRSGGIYLGWYNNGPIGAIVKDNWLHSAWYCMTIRNDAECTVKGNTFYTLPGEQTSNQTTSDGQNFSAKWPDNIYHVVNQQSRTGDTTFVFPNQYETGRANISIVNFAGNDSVWVNVGNVFSDGDLVDVYNVQNYFGDIPFRGTVRGTRLRIPVLATRWTQAIPSGESQPLDATTFPYWGAFIVKEISLPTETRSTDRRLGPDAIELLQNYPNPFNPETRIVFRIEGSGVREVKLVVYDLLGREAAVLVNEKKEPGTYDVAWDALGFSSGVYVCRLSAGGIIESKKMQLLK